MALKTSTNEELPSVNLTPMIDVVFLLIIFFMVGTQFTKQERHIKVQLPGAGKLQAMVQPPERREVFVTADGSISLEGMSLDPVSLTQELEAMRRQFPDIGVVVRADGKAEHQHVAAVYGAINRAGVSDMAIAVRYQPEQVR